MTGLTGDAASIFWNPAGIVNVANTAVHFSHMEWFRYFDFTTASMVLNRGRWGSFGVGVIVFRMEEMEITTEYEPNGTGRFFDAQDLALNFTYARSLTDRFQVGLTGKYIHQRIWNETAKGMAIDVGTQYRIDFRNLALAMSMTNFGPNLRMTGPELSVTYDADPNFPNRIVPAMKQTEDYPLPLNFKFGIAVDLLNTPLLKIRNGLDVIHPNDNDERIQVGTEVSFADRFYLRGGYQFGHDSERGNAGFGIHTALSGYILSLDYSYSMYDLLPDIQQVSVGLSF
ncbi:PorV/PorQ family protein [Candidatus Neomarinimicrobiota bacterium]